VEELAVVKIIFKDGSVGYFKDNDHITSFKDQAFKADVDYANGLCRGLNFAIETYQDELTDHAEVEVL
jgi:hypothetical protein